MAAGPQRRVDVDAVRPNIQKLQCLAEENRNVLPAGVGSRESRLGS